MKERNIEQKKNGREKNTKIRADECGQNNLYMQIESKIIYQKQVQISSL